MEVCCAIFRRRVYRAENPDDQGQGDQHLDDQHQDDQHQDGQHRDDRDGHRDGRDDHRDAPRHGQHPVGGQALDGQHPVERCHRDGPELSRRGPRRVAQEQTCHLMERDAQNRDLPDGATTSHGEPKNGGRSTGASLPTVTRMPT